MATDNLSTLTQEQLKALLHYDPETGVFVWITRRGTRGVIGRIAGSFDPKGYRLIRIYERNYRAHRLACLYMTGCWPEYEIDHMNGCRDDNRWVNLRDATPAENQQNTTPRGGSSEYHGVYWNKKAKKWRAYINANRKRTHLGSFDTEDAAAQAYLDAKAKHHEFQPIPRHLPQ